jgi:hypothetical protein
MFHWCILTNLNPNPTLSLDRARENINLIFLARERGFSDFVIKKAPKGLA